MSKTQYRITLNGAVSPIVDEQTPDHWSRICDFIEQRGGKAVYETRLAFMGEDVDIVDGLVDKTGWLLLPKMVVSPWSVLAQIEA